MKVRVEVGAWTIQRLVRDYIAAKVPAATIYLDQIKFKLLPIRKRRKHPRQCPIAVATLKTDI